MEIQPFFMSTLPTDVTYNIYWKLCMLKAIPKDLKYEITWFHKYLYVLHLYRDEFSNAPNCTKCDFYLYWLENNLVLALNDGIPTSQGVSPELRHEYPFITTDFLRKTVPSEKIRCRTFRLWSLLNIRKKIEFVIDLQNHTSPRNWII